MSLRNCMLVGEDGWVVGLYKMSKTIIQEKKKKSMLMWMDQKKQV